MIPKQDLPAFYNVVINADSHSLDSYHVLESFKFQPGIIVSLKRPVENLISHLREKGIELHEETHFIDGRTAEILLEDKPALFLYSPYYIYVPSPSIHNLAVEILWIITRQNIFFNKFNSGQIRTNFISSCSSNQHV